MAENKKRRHRAMGAGAPVNFELSNPVADLAATALSCACPWRAVNRGSEMFCTACGAASAEGARFCGHCGAALNGQTLQLNYTDDTTLSEINQVRPWVRYWARMFDIYVWAILAGIAIYASGADLSRTPSVVIGCCVLLTWIFAEALFLSSFGATPGKWIFRTTVLAATGDHPGYIQALRRSAAVWVKGLAMGLPLIYLGTMVYSKTQLSKNGITSWDKKGGFTVTHERIGGPRVAFASAFLTVAAIASFIFTIESPPISANVTSELATKPAATTAAQPVAANEDLAPVTHQTDAATERARWNADVEAMFQAHPALNYQHNASIMQEKVNTIATPAMSNQQLLDMAYQETVNDPRWASTP